MKYVLLGLGFLCFAGSVFADESFSEQRFSEEAYRRVEPIYRQILEHPFNQELARGTLAREKFVHYTSQDVLYLVRFGQVLSLLASKLDDPSDVKAVLDLARRCLLEEKAAQEKAGRLIQGGLEVSVAAEMSPATFSYVNFLLATAAHGSREELAAALLPCFWTYLKLAQDLTPFVAAESAYWMWIDNYSSPSYSKTVSCMQAIVDRLAGQATAETRIKMLKAFEMGVRLEWRFWDGAYRLETWTNSP